ncbi:MAG: hypothetical protein UIH27_08060 [Ruminococcus sp.]|nr:hypothetical protein [Ruminococcus sp.]
MYKSPDLVKVDVEIKDNYAAYQNCDATIGYMFSISTPCDGNPSYYFNAPAGIGYSANNCWTSPHA